MPEKHFGRQTGTKLPALKKTLGGKNHRFTSVGVEIDPKTTLEEWRVLGVSLSGAERAMRWYIADFLAFGDKFGEAASQVINDFGYDYFTLANWKWTATRIDISRRRENLSFGHHQAVAPLDPEEQEKWLSAAEEHGWTREELRNAIAANGSSTRVLGSVRIGSLLIRIEDDTLTLAIEQKGVWRDVLVEDLDSLRRKKRILQANAIITAFEKA